MLTSKQSRVFTLAIIALVMLLGTCLTYAQTQNVDKSQVLRAAEKMHQQQLRDTQNATYNRTHPTGPVQVLREAVPATRSNSGGMSVNSIDELNTLVTIGTGTLTQYYPWWYWWYTQTSAGIYTAAEIGQGGLITSISWDATAAVNWSTCQNDTVEIWLVETANTSFAASPTWNSIAGGATMVYHTGGVNPNFTTGWNTFTLDTPYLYSGTNNLMIITRTYQSTDPGSTSSGWLSTTTASNQFTAWYGDNAFNPGTTWNIAPNTTRPNIQINIGVGAATNPVPSNGAAGVPINAGLNWTAAPSAINYDVKLDVSTPPTAQVAEAITATQYQPGTNLLSNQTYYWQIVSHDSFSSLDSPIWSFTTGSGNAPLAPTNGTVTNPGTDNLTINWTDNSSDETGFPIVRAITGDTSYIAVTTAAANTATYQNTGLTPSTEYTYHVYSQNSNATSVNFASASGWTNPVSASSPTLVPSGQGFYTIAVTALGTDNNGPTTRYKLHETTRDLWISASGTLDPTNARLSTRTGWNNFVVSGLTSGATYTFAVVAVNGNNIEAAAGPAGTITTNDINHGGPDAYGYRYITSNAIVGGPTYSWITPSGTANTVSGWSSTDDGNAGPYNIGFNFTFYGRTYTQWYAGSNGRIQFGSANPYNYTSTVFPLSTYPAGIYFWNYDMTVANTTVVYENLTNPSRLVITYTGFMSLGGMGPIACQVIIYEDGQVMVNYGPQTGTTTSFFSASALQDTSGINGTLQYGPPVPAATTAYLFFRLGTPANPVPANLATNVPTNTSLSWSPAIAALNYSVLFGTSNPPSTVVSAHQTGLTYSTELSSGTTYYWQVVAYGDSAGNMSNPGPVWTFSTGSGSAPAAPTSGAFVSSTLTTLTGSFTDNADNETGFPITKSIDGTTYNTYYTAAASAGTGAVSLTDTGLTFNTHYWYHIYAQNAAATSLNFASVNGWTLAHTPDTASFISTGITSATIALHSGGNPTITQFAMMDSLSNQYVQSNGTFGAFAVWQTLGQWGTTTSINSLVANTTYYIKVKARNGANVETAFSPSVMITTNNAYTLPFMQNFSSTTFPPGDWTVVRTGGTAQTWLRQTSASGSPAWAYVPYMTVSSIGQHDYLITPPISTVGVPGAELDFNWGYQNYTGYHDTLYIAYTLDNGTTYNIFWSRWGTGVGENNLLAGDGNTTIAPTSFANAGLANVPLPAGALGQSSVRFAFIGVNEYGQNIYVSNIQLFSLTLPRIGFSVTNASFGYRVTNGTYTRSVYVRNVGADTLQISNVTSGSVTPSWTTHTIMHADSALLDLTWSPTTSGNMSDTVHITSNASNASVGYFTVSGTAVDVATIPFSQGFTSATPWPPFGWQSIYPTSTTYYWQYSTNGNGSANGAAYFNMYYAPANTTCILWTPPVNTVDVTAARIDFDWWFSGSYVGTDTLWLVYSLDGGITYTPFWARYNTGTGGPAGTDLRTCLNTANYYQMPATTATEWASTTVMVPDAALGINGVTFGWVAKTGTTMYTGSSLGIDNIMVNFAGMAYLDGRVMRADNTPVEAADVTVSNSRNMRWTTTTDAAGAWLVSVLADTYNINVNKPCLYPNTDHAGAVLTVGDTIHFYGDTLYAPVASATPTSLEYMVEPGGTSTQTIVLTNTGDWPEDFQAQIEYPTGFDKAKRSTKSAMISSPIVTNKTILTSDRVGGKKPAEMTVVPVKSGKGQAVSTAISIPGKSIAMQMQPSKSPTNQIASVDELNSAVIIGTGTSSQSFPFYNFWWYTRSASIYTAAEMGRAGRIDSIGWYATVAGIWNETTEHAYIYLMHTQLSTFTATTYSTFQSTATLVKTIDHYTGPAVMNDWDMMALDTPFEYNGTDNLLVIVQIDQSGYPTTSQQNTYTATTGTAFQYWYQDSTPPTGTGYVTTNRPNIRMDLITFDYAAVSPEAGQVIPSEPFELSVTISVPDTTPDQSELSANVLVTTNACTTLTIPILIHVRINSVANASNLPHEYKLYQNYPNPFNPTTEIRFDLKNAGMTRLTVYNSLGQEVTRLVSNYLPAGFHSVRFKADRLATGVYFYRLESGSFTSLKKMVMVK